MHRNSYTPPESVNAFEDDKHFQLPLEQRTTTKVSSITTTTKVSLYYYQDQSNVMILAFDVILMKLSSKKHFTPQGWSPVSFFAARTAREQKPSPLLKPYHTRASKKTTPPHQNTPHQNPPHYKTMHPITKNDTASPQKVSHHNKFILYYFFIIHKVEKWIL